MDVNNVNKMKGFIENPSFDNLPTLEEASTYINLSKSFKQDEALNKIAEIIAKGIKENKLEHLLYSGYCDSEIESKLSDKGYSITASIDQRDVNCYYINKKVK